MKKLLILFPAILILTMLSVKGQEQQVALVTFYGDKKIGGTGLGSTTEALIKDPSFNLQPVVDKAYQRFVNEFAKDFPFKLMNADEVSNNPDYKNYRSLMLVDTAKTVNKVLGIQYAVAPGLIWAFADVKAFIGEEKRDPCNLAKIFPNGVCSLACLFDYRFAHRPRGNTRKHAGRKWIWSTPVERRRDHCSGSIEVRWLCNGNDWQVGTWRARHRW